MDDRSALDDVDAAFKANAVLVAPASVAHPRTSWRPLRVYSHNAELGTYTSAVYGYRAECSCGWLGKVRQNVSGCRFDIAQHRDEAHDGR